MRGSAAMPGATTPRARRPEGRRGLACAVVVLAALWGVAAEPVHAQWRRRTEEPPGYRFTALADWELQRSSTDLQGETNTSSGFVQRYSLGLDGVLWDQRLARFSVGLELLRSDRRAGSFSVKTRDLGYWGQLFLFNNRPFPLRLYARRAAADATGTAAFDDRRELSAFGLEWRLLDHGARTIRVLWDDTTLKLHAPPAREQHQATALAEIRQRYWCGEVSFQANRQNVDENVIDLRRRRQDYLLTNRTELTDTATILITADHTTARADYADGAGDDLTTNRALVQLDMPGEGRMHWAVDYDYSDNRGKFARGRNHEGRATGRFEIGKHWEASVGAVLGKLTAGPADDPVNVDRAGGRGGVRYTGDRDRWHFGAGYTLGLDRLKPSVGPERRETSHMADVSARRSVGAQDAVYGQLTLGRNNNDTTGVGYTFSETRATVGWDKALGGSWRADSALEARSTRYDTFQFGQQDSREIGVRSSVSWWRGAFAVQVSSRRGISDFFPGPDNAGPFIEGTYLENKAVVVAANGMLHLVAHVDLRGTASVERRSYTEVGDENVTSLHPEVVWDWRTWRVAAGVAHYSRTNGTVYRDTTWLLKITKQFL